MTGSNLCYSRCKNAQFCNINIAIQGYFVGEVINIGKFNTNRRRPTAALRGCEPCKCRS